jgi:glutathione S-transferase
VSLADRLGQLDAFPTLNSYLARCTQRPAFARAVEKGIE